MIYLTSAPSFGFGQGLFCIVGSRVVISSADLPLQPCEGRRHATDTTLYFPFFFSPLLLFYWCKYYLCFHTIRRLQAQLLRFIYIISRPVCHFVCSLLWYFKLHPCLKLLQLKQCVKPYFHTQQVVVLLDGSPTGTLPALVVIVTDVQPRDIGLLFTVLQSVVCSVIRVYTFLSERALQGPGRRRGGGVT